MLKTFALIGLSAQSVGQMMTVTAGAMAVKKWRIRVMKPTKAELIMALRCSASPRQEGDSCVGCPYRGFEKVDKSIPCPADTIMDGVEYWEYCDVEQMALDAADYLEVSD